MWMPRVKIRIENKMENKYYELDKWTRFSNFKDKDIYYRFNSKNYIEFAICFYDSKEEALMDGKIFYYNVLYNGYYSFFNYKMGDNDYVTRMYHKEGGYTHEEFIKNEEWFFSCKKNGCNFIGLQIYEVDNLEDFEFYNREVEFEIKSILDQEIDLIKYLKNIDYDCIYSEKTQKIFNLFRLVENANNEIQILLLCQILETMGINESKSEKSIIEIDKCKHLIMNSELEQSEKDSIIGGLEHLKSQSSGKKIKKLVSKYCKKDYKKFKKNRLITDCYNLRSKIIHGEELLEGDNVFLNAYFLKFLALDTFKEWSKENQ